MGIVLTEVHRGDAVESRHTGAVAIARPGAELGAGGAEQPVWCRSAVKPFQALPLFDRGIVDDLGLDDRELAVISASHNGTDEHVAVVEGLLHRAGLASSDPSAIATAIPILIAKALASSLSSAASS